MSLRVLIADDERLSRERLKRFLEKEPETELVAECASGGEALTAIRLKSPDIVFLDIRMPEMDGFGVLDCLRGSRLPAVIFVTAYDHFALRAFEIDAVDYLLKPFDRPRFQAALRRARNRLGLQTSGLALSSGNPRSLARTMDRIAVPSSGKILLINLADIQWISAADNYVELHVGTKVHLLRIPISVLAARLPTNQFTRISRSALVNLDAIKEIHSKSHGDYFLVLQSGETMAGSRKYRHGLGFLMRRKRTLTAGLSRDRP